MKKGKTPSEVNLLDLIPVHNITWEKTKEGKVVLLKPKFQNPFLVKYLVPRLKKPYFKVKLDEVGSFFWKNCDGQRSVKELAHLHKKKFGNQVEPLYERISAFIHTLEKSGFLLLKHPQKD